MVRKKIDSRIKTLIENAVHLKQRSFFVVIGDKGKDQVVNLHYMLSKAQVASRPNVLWCYKKELGFSSNRQKRMRQIKKQMQKGLLDPDQDNPFELFIASTDIRYTYYKETDKILGNTYGMCVLQDFEALTPNLLARTIETVQGTGIVVLLLRTMSSLKQLYAMTMDVHSRYRCEAHTDVVARFNERFLLSLATNPHCLVLDDQLNVLPISAHIRNIKPLAEARTETKGRKSQSDIELEELKKSLEDTQPIGNLVNTAKTLDQAKALLTFLEAISEKDLRTTVALTAGRGRGKSAALGVAMAGAIGYGYANVFVTSPSPENLKTLFQFIFKAFDALGYEEHLDYDIVQSTNPDFNKAIVRVNIFKNHRQTIQYIQPQDAHVLGQAELLVIDEAAAIPLPLVKQLLGPYLVFMASTINGYEGTGRSLSLKLVQQLRDQSAASVTAKPSKANPEVGGGSVGGRKLKELKLDEPIRYAAGDPVEAWLNQLLCLDASIVPRVISGCPHPSQCDLYYVNRDTLFSFHPTSETFLQRMMSLYVASHYKNSPNDLQLLSDAPAHQLFVLLAPVDAQSGQLPEILCVMQVCLEGQISKDTIMRSLSRGRRGGGDLIPWSVSQQFQDEEFGGLSGGRVVRIATHPDYQKMGYGSRALELLEAFYSGKITNMSESNAQGDVVTEAPRVDDNEMMSSIDGQGSMEQLQEEQIKPRSNLPPLLVSLEDMPTSVPRLHWLGVSYGVTPSLLKFWKKSGYVPVYLRQTPNSLTGEHTCIMIKSLATDDLEMPCADNWLQLFWLDFRKRFLSLLASAFRGFTPAMALSILEAPSLPSFQVKVQDDKTVGFNEQLTPDVLDKLFSRYDLKRLASYANSTVDYHMILDLVPTIAELFFRPASAAATKASQIGDKTSAPGSSTPFSLSPVQRAILLSLGLQRKDIDGMQQTLSLPATQLLAMFSKVIRKVSQYFDDVRMQHIAQADASSSTKSSVAQVPTTPTSVPGVSRDLHCDEEWDPTTATLADDLDDGAQEFREKQKELVKSLDLTDYAIDQDDQPWDDALAAVSDKTKVISVAKKKAKATPDAVATKEKKASSGKKSKRHGSSTRKGHKKAKIGGK